MANKLKTIGFDADDTLWQNEQFFRITQERFASLLADYAGADHLASRLLAADQLARRSNSARRSVLLIARPRS